MQMYCNIQSHDALHNELALMSDTKSSVSTGIYELREEFWVATPLIWLSSWPQQSMLLRGSHKARGAPIDDIQKSLPFGVNGLYETLFGVKAKHSMSKPMLYSSFGVMGAIGSS